jgi:hypothetical protein
MRIQDPHREKGPHPEGTPKAAVSKHGRKNTACQDFSHAFALLQAGEIRLIVCLVRSLST